VLLTRTRADDLIRFRWRIIWVLVPASAMIDSWRRRASGDPP
jgi:hypothetical protein